MLHKMGWAVHFNNSQLISRAKFCKQSMLSQASNQFNLPCTHSSHMHCKVRDDRVKCLLRSYLLLLSTLPSSRHSNCHSYLCPNLANSLGNLILLWPAVVVTQPITQLQQMHKKEHCRISLEQLQTIRRAALLHLTCQKP